MMDEEKRIKEQDLGKKSAYNSIFWGLILVLFDFRIAFFDFLPDSFGYILAASALRKLAAASDYFGKAKPYAYFLIVFSLTDFAMMDRQGATAFILSRENIAFMLVAFTTTILTLFMVYYICQGISERALKLGAEELRHKANRRWRLFFAANLIILAVTPFGLNLPPSLIIYAVSVSMIIGVISYILIIAMVSDADKMDSSLS